MPVLLAPTELLARVHHSVPASAVPCTPPAAHPLPVAVLPWPGVLEWVRVPVGRRVPVVCWVLPLVLRLRAQRRVPALARVRLPAVPDSVIKVLAASRKDR